MLKVQISTTDGLHEQFYL